MCWKILFVTQMVLIFGRVCSDESKACFGVNGIDCATHTLNCINGGVIDLCEAYYKVSNLCPLVGILDCSRFFDNITVSGTRYKFNETEWKELNTICSSRSRCEYRAGRNVTYDATFSIVKYVCIQDSETCHSYLTTPPPRQSATNGIPGGTACNEKEDGIIGPVAGGVTVAVLVIVAIVLFFLWFKYKRNQNSKTTSSIGKSSSENYSETTRIPVHNYHEIEVIQQEQPMSNYDYAAVAGEVNHIGQEGQSAIEEGKPKETGDHASTKLTVKSYNNKSFTENEDDYNHLASKVESKTIENGVHSGGYDTAASACKSVQQIRNEGVSNVDSDYDYNRTDNNPKPKPLQGDYDTTASASKAVAQMMQTDKQFEDDYDHFRQIKAGSQSVHSPYDTAEHHSEQSGDYSIAGVLQKNDPYDLAK